MKNSRLEKLQVNALTGPKVKAPAVSPDTLREMCDPFSGYFQVYCLESRKAKWHGHLKNIGMQYTIPLTVILPPQVTEMLGLNNDDHVELYQSSLSEARTVYFRRMADTANPDLELPELMMGSELFEDNLDFTYQGAQICLEYWEPEFSFIGPGTQIIESNGSNPADFMPENDVNSVFTDDPETKQLPPADTDYININKEKDK